MGKDLYEEYDLVRELFEMAEETVKINLSKFCFKGPMETLTQTINLQPAVTTVNLAFYKVLVKEGVKADFCAGHSLGEYSALYAAGVLSDQDVIRCVHKRGELMHRESVKNSGAMYALVGLGIDEVEQLVSEASEEGIVAVANHNTETQIVISGTPDAAGHVANLAGERGVKAIKLKVSGAWHCDLMKGAEKEFTDFLETLPFSEPQTPIILNITADFETTVEAIRSAMGQQLCNRVRWFDSMKKLLDENIDVFVEIGPGKVLTGLLKKIKPKDYPCEVFTVSNMKSLENCLKAVL